MEAKDILTLGLKQLQEKKARTALTVLMVVIGVAAIVALTSQTAGTTASIKNSLESLGPTSILVTPSSGTVFTTATEAEIEGLPNVSDVIPIVSGSGTLNVNGENYSVSIYGVPSNDLKALLGTSSYLYQGSNYSDNVTPDALVGYSIAFSSSTDPTLQTVAVDDIGALTTSSTGSEGKGGSSSSSKVSIPIVGVLQEHSSSLVDVDSGLVVSQGFAEVLLHKTSFNELVVQANSATNVSAVVSMLDIVFGDSARVTDTQQLASTITSITSSTSDLYIIIAAISLLVAAIGIMNVMMMSVSERVHDIGIFKSIGFESRDVLLIFLLQAIIIGAVGGIIGVGAGVGASYAVSSAGGLHSTPTAGAPTAFSSSSSFRGGGGFSGAGGGGAEVFTGAPGGGGFVTSTASASASSTSSTTTTVEPVFTASVVIEALVIAVIISIIAGIYPAWRASKMQPVDALRIL